MPRRPDEECVQGPEKPSPVTPTKSPHNAGAGHYNPGAENLECQYVSIEPFRKKKRRRVDKQILESYLLATTTEPRLQIRHIMI